MNRFALLALAAILAACSKDIQNTEAVHSAVIDYLASRSGQTGLNVGQMQVDIVAVSFEKDVARTTVSVKPKGTTSGMQMSYTLDRSGDKWVVRPSANLHPGAMPEGAVPGTVMPPGTKAPPIPPGATMPAGHPPIGKQ